MEDEGEECSLGSDRRGRFQMSRFQLTGFFEEAFNQLEPLLLQSIERYGFGRHIGDLGGCWILSPCPRKMNNGL